MFVRKLSGVGARAVDSIKWLRVPRDPRAEVFGLYGLDVASSHKESNGF